MKKATAWLLLFVLMLACAYTQAEDTRELTFLDIPWFSSPKEVSDILVNSGFLSAGFSEKQINAYAPQQAKNENGVTYAKSNVGSYPSDPECPYTFESKGRPTLTRKLSTVHDYTHLRGIIGGKRAAGLILYFTSDEENRQFVECRIGCSKGCDPDAVLEELKESYGEPTTSRGNVEHVWLGDNNTILIYFMRKNIIIYATIDGLKLADTYDINVPDDAGSEE